jgi:3-oxoadipate enol-lactonase
MSFRCIVYDNRGTGRTSKPQTGYSARILADDAATLLEALKIDAAHVAGWSLGSRAAQELAINYPRRVPSLLLYSTWDRCYPHFRRRFELQAQIAKLERTDMLTAFAALTLFSPTFINDHDGEVAAFEKQLYPSTTRQCPGRPSYVLLGHYEADIMHDTSGRLSQITVPTLLVTGAEDPLTRPEYARAVHLGIRSSELVVLEGADHMMPIKQAERLNDVTLAFLRKHSVLGGPPGREQR